MKAARHILLPLSVLTLLLAMTLWLRSPAPDEAGEHVSLPAPQPISLLGELECLPRKVDNVTTSVACALGFKDAVGNHYALHDNAPGFENLMKVPQGVPAYIEGTFVAQDDPQYTSLGIINVDSLRPASDAAPAY
jgi:hypothetical protein